MDDRALVAAQLGRTPRAFRRVVCRCPFGTPAVTEQSPCDDSGEPFPTTYWLTCRHLVAAVSRLEAAGGVERWTTAVREQPELRASLERANAEQRRLRHELAPGWDHPSLDAGIGGSSRDGSLKCLHAHVAFALARRGAGASYELGERIVAELEPIWPDRCCTERRRS
jgi:hypothetical protein